MRIRQMTAEDIPAVAQIEKECFSQPWSEQGFLDGMKDAIFFVAEDPQIAGYIGMYRMPPEGEITNVAVTRKMRGKGYGRELLLTMQRWAAEHEIDRIILEVRSKNEPAIQLYRTYGFEKIGVRKNFYQFPREDADIMEFHAPELDAADLDDAADLTGADMPSPSAYLSARQKNGKPLGADIVYKETWLWLKQRGCEKHVNKRLLESYSQAFARFVQCEEALSTYGLLGKHPTTGGVIASPFVQMSQTFQKQANLLWYEIFDIVKQNCTTKFDGTPQDDLMEQLLSNRK